MNLSSCRGYTKIILNISKMRIFPILLAMIMAFNSAFGIRCGVREVYNPCATPCPLTCDNIHDPPHCSPGIVCQEGCECKEGFVLHNGVCVPIDSCPGLYCIGNRTYEFRDIHVTTCDNVNLYPLKPGCYCKFGYFLNRHDGRCVLEEDCPKKFECPFKHEKLNLCRPSCPPTCRDPKPQPCYLAERCRKGCVCEEGYVRDTENGNCVEIGHCPVEKCYGRHETFQECGSYCPAVCGEAPKACILICVRGCFCEPGYIRDRKTGECISEEECKKRI